MSKPASLHQAFSPEEAWRLVACFEVHCTQKHVSWPDLAESELGALSSQSLDRRPSDVRTLINEVAGWQADRNKHHAKADWQFTTDDARIKLKHLHPLI